MCSRRVCTGSGTRYVNLITNPISHEWGSTGKSLYHVFTKNDVIYYFQLFLFIVGAVGNEHPPINRSMSQRNFTRTVFGNSQSRVSDLSHVKEDFENTPRIIRTSGVRESRGIGLLSERSTLRFWYIATDDMMSIFSTNFKVVTEKVCSIQHYRKSMVVSGFPYCGTRVSSTFYFIQHCL